MNTSAYGMGVELALTELAETFGEEFVEKLAFFGPFKKKVKVPEEVKKTISQKIKEHVGKHGKAYSAGAGAAGGVGAGVGASALYHRKKKK